MIVRECKGSVIGIELVEEGVIAGASIVADGHWITIKAGSYRASICIENLHGIAKEALLKWAEWVWSKGE